MLPTTPKWLASSRFLPRLRVRNDWGRHTTVPWERCFAAIMIFILVVACSTRTTGLLQVQALSTKQGDLVGGEALGQAELEQQFFLASTSRLTESVAASSTPSPLIPNAALSPTILSSAQLAALCDELCPSSPASCAVKFIYGTGTTYCCSGAFFVHGSIGHRCSDQSLPKMVPSALLNRIITQANISGAAAADKPPGTITQANMSTLALIGRGALQRINQVRAAQHKEPIIWSQAVYESVSYWLSYLDSTHLFITQNLGQPAKPFPPGALFLAEVVLAQRLPENITAAEAGIACGNALLSGNISAEITLGNYEFGAVGALPRSTGLEWLCSISLGNLFRFGGTSFPNTTQS
ncbi:hypothetical protein F1559_002410 [Cyanidiococcus yangmingshanensis]|uniref:Uncharacterized protein n=1 Tax=Cyanidiococcus yangmingshanensis TaxID=2690220 RepID=A0A7J7IH61_9RHOD|nr:hypothetical protein F1559_002410 [Cyanidiococcus yangmingshanensis]